MEPSFGSPAPSTQERAALGCRTGARRPPRWGRGASRARRAVTAEVRQERPKTQLLRSETPDSGTGSNPSTLSPSSNVGPAMVPVSWGRWRLNQMRCGFAGGALPLSPPHVLSPRGSVVAAGPAPYCTWERGRGPGGPVCRGRRRPADARSFLSGCDRVTWPLLEGGRAPGVSPWGDAGAGAPG